KSKANKTGRKMLNRAKKVICHEQMMRLDNRINTPYVDLEYLWAQHPTLAHIYEMRKELQAIWQKSTQNMNEMAQDLQSWCQQAEASQIKALNDFAHYLRSYSMPDYLVQH
ncbi:MAG: transposase, partial [Pseudomonadales bacterium]|nr:transposase [Pseudomonadales bacterium]